MKAWAIADARVIRVSRALLRSQRNMVAANACEHVRVVGPLLAGRRATAKSVLPAVRANLVRGCPSAPSPYVGDSIEACARLTELLIPDFLVRLL